MSKPFNFHMKNTILHLEEEKVCGNILNLRQQKDWESFEAGIDETFLITRIDQEEHDLNWKYLDNANKNKSIACIMGFFVTF